MLSPKNMSLSEASITISTLQVILQGFSQAETFQSQEFYNFSFSFRDIHLQNETRSADCIIPHVKFLKPMFS